IARAVKIGKALGQVYGLMLLGQGAHLGKIVVPSAGSLLSGIKIARAVKIGKALGQVYGLMLLGQGAHLGKIVVP
ncbi:hypothetical protein CJ430_31270, partial [Klebsiella pneumoniae]